MTSKLLQLLVTVILKLCWSQSTSFNRVGKWESVAVPFPSTSIRLRRYIVTFIEVFVHKSPLFDNIFVVCNQKLGVPERQHKFSSPEWEIYKVFAKH